MVSANSRVATPIRAGHWAALEAMQRPEFVQIVQAFDRVPEIGGTYFRLVEKGFQPVDLDPHSPKPLMGVGGSFRPRATAAQLEAELPARLALLLANRSKKDTSREKQVEAAAVRAALATNLRLEGLGTNLRLVASQWRIDLGGRGKILDLLAVDIATASLVVIELKPKPDETAVPQASRYAEYLRRQDRVTCRFFAELGLAMARLYGCDDFPDALVPGRVGAIAAWPARAGHQKYEVIPCP